MILTKSISKQFMISSMKIDLADSLLVDIIKSNYSEDPIQRKMQEELVCQMENRLLSLDSSIDLCNNTIKTNKGT